MFLPPGFICKPSRTVQGESSAGLDEAIRSSPIKEKSIVYKRLAGG
jgi:hypothetical protein